MASESPLSDDDSGSWAQRRQRDPALTLRNRTRRAERPALSHDDYTVAWICALSLELTASRAMFDVVHENLVAQRGDDNAYILGRIAHHNVVMVALPGAYGKVNAATVSTNLKRTFPNIAATLMVGIGGGAPGEASMRLGDVVVATRVTEYDLGKALDDGRFESTADPKRPSQFLLSAVTALRSKHGQSPTSSRMLQLLQSRLADHERPKQFDRLFKSTYHHPAGAITCEDCERSFLQPRSMRPSTVPWIHYGGIASGDSVNKDAQKRDAISRRLNAVCFEMEAAGMMDNLQCLPIRGICDYSDSHKNDHWQPYAAATAAAYARELLETIQVPGNERISSTSPAATSSAASTIGKQTLIALLDFPQMDDRRAAIRPPQKKTCLWLLHHPLYLTWLDPDEQESHHGFLWMRGKAGAGKSTLVNFLYTEASDANGSMFVISYFFNARGEYLEKSTTGMFRSFLKHLLSHMSVREWRRMMYEAKIASFDKRTCPGFNQLKHMLRTAVLVLNHRSLIFFIDALDECDEDDVRDMVRFFEDLAEDATERGIQLRVCFSSRPYPYISIRRGLLLTLEEEAGHTADLTQYVNKRLRVQDQHREEFESHILAKASGIFMWVVLVVDILNKESNRGGLSLRRRLSEIPPGLGQLFKDILKRDQENPQDLRRCILWILCTRQPLEPDEFRHAMWAAGLSDGRVDDELPSIVDPESSNALVISSSKGLAEVTPGRWPVVQFIHESVRDFLVRDRGLQELWPDLGFEWEGSAHESIRSCCELYLTAVFSLHGLGSFQEEIYLKGNEANSYFTPNDNTRWSPKKPPPFLSYANNSLLYHSNLAAPYLSQKPFLARLFGFKSETAIDYKKEVSIPHAVGRSLYPRGSVLEGFTHLGLGNLVRLAIDTMRASETNGQISLQYRRAFFAAFQMDPEKNSVARAMIAPLLGLSSLVYKGRMIETICHTTNVSRRRSPLSWASEEGHHTLAKVLIRNGESLVEIDPEGNSPLQLAARNRHVSIILLLISSGLDMKTDEVECEIGHALEKGHHEVARILLTHYDVDNTLGDDPGKTRSLWLLFAASQAPLDIVGLLAGSSKVNLGDALKSAIRAGRREIVALLIDRGAIVNAQDKWGWTPLMMAVKYNQAETALLLIDKGANLNVVNKTGRTARDLAVRFGHRNLAQRLNVAGSGQGQPRQSSGTRPME